MGMGMIVTFMVPLRNTLRADMTGGLSGVCVRTWRRRRLTHQTGKRQDKPRPKLKIINNRRLPCNKSSPMQSRAPSRFIKTSDFQL